MTLEDFEKADAIFILGQNPGTNHPRMMTVLEAREGERREDCRDQSDARAGIDGGAESESAGAPEPAEFAAKMLFNKGTPLSDLWLPVQINGDMAAMRGIMKEMLAEEERAPGSVFDHAFHRRIHRWLRAIRRGICATTSWDDILEGSGLTREQIRAGGARSRWDANASSAAGRWD